MIFFRAVHVEIDLKHPGLPFDYLSGMKTQITRISEG